MNRNELKALLKGALTKDASVNFADREEAAVDALLEHYGLDRNASYRQLKRVSFDVIEEVIDEIVPAMVENIMGGFATVLSFGRDQEVVYQIKNVGKRRALLSIVPGARAGIYKARKLDGRTLSIKTHTLTAGVFVHLEDILLGKASLGELMDNILDGIQYQIYKDVVSALRAIKTQAPAANRATAANVDAAKLNDVIRVVSAYGKPVIICFHSLAVKFNNMVNVSGAQPNMPGADLDEMRNKGVVSMYHGTPVIEVPNYILDEVENSSWLFSEADAFVLPVDEKPVIVAFQGEGYIQENAHALGGAEQNYHRMMGTAILAYNNLGIYTDSEIVKAEENKKLI
jgi:hypothetical protein